MCGCGLKSIENTLAFLIKNTDWSFQRIMCKCVFWSWLKFCLLLLISLSLRQCFYTTFLCYRFCCPSRLHHCKDIDHVFDTTIRRISLCWVNINTVFLIILFLVVNCTYLKKKYVRGFLVWNQTSLRVKLTKEGHDNFYTFRKGLQKETTLSFENSIWNYLEHKISKKESESNKLRTDD